MRMLTGFLVFLGTITLNHGVALCLLEPHLEGTVTRIDTETYRVEVTVTWLGDAPSEPPATCHDAYATSPVAGTRWLALSGSFENPLNHGCDEFPGRIFCYGAFEASFTFSPRSGQSDITVDYSTYFEGQLEMYHCDQPDPCPEPCRVGSGYFAGRTTVFLGEGGGRVYAELPQGIDEPIPLREIPVAVHEGTWSQIKRLFR